MGVKRSIRKTRKSSMSERKAPAKDNLFAVVKLWLAYFPRKGYVAGLEMALVQCLEKNTP